MKYCAHLDVTGRGCGWYALPDSPYCSQHRSFYPEPVAEAPAAAPRSHYSLPKKSVWVMVVAMLVIAPGAFLCLMVLFLFAAFITNADGARHIGGGITSFFR